MPERVSPAGGRWSTFRLIVMVRLRRRTGYSVIRALSPVRSISSCVGTWLLSSHDSRAAPQTVQTTSPVCGTKNFSSVRLYSAPQLHCTIVAIKANMRFGPWIFQPGTYALCQEPPLLEPRRLAYRLRGGGAPSG